MRIRVLTLASLLLATATSFAQAPLEPQQAFKWPPKAVPNQKTGKVPDFKEKNLICMDCHKEIMQVTTANKKIPNLHRLHLESKKIAYKGENRDCLVCHEMMSVSETKAPRKEGWFVKGDVYHLNTMRDLPGSNLWKKQIVRSGNGTESSVVGTLRPEDPYIYKPTLKRLVCVECHGPDSKIKTFYGVPDAGQ